MRPLRAPGRSASVTHDHRAVNPSYTPGFSRAASGRSELWAASEHETHKDPYTAWVAQREREQRPEIHWRNAGVR
jgi:hypothetical protein